MQYLQAYLFKHFSSLCVLGLMCSTLLFSYSATAADIAGRIIMARGDVKAVNSEGSIRQLKRRDSIYSHEIIKTGKASKVQIRFIDNALLALKAESELNIKAYVYSTENEEDNQVLMELVAGGFRTLTGKIGKGNKEAYKVETPVASIGIRGTLYDVQLAVDKIFAGVWKGGISLDTPQGQFNLGIGSDFDFGEISASGVFTGLLNPPAAFTPQTPASGSDSNTKDETNDGSSTATDSFSDSNNGNSDNNSDGETNNSPLIDSAAPNTSIPSPFEKDGLPDETIAENDSFIAFLDINPNAKGHTLVVPKKEENKIFDLSKDEYSNLMDFSYRVAKALEKAIPCKRIGMSVIGLEVPHVHVHLIPINAMADMQFTHKIKVSNDEFVALAEIISGNFE